VLTLMLFAPMIAGCAATSDFFSSDLLSKDAEWFSRSGRVFIKNVSIETPPLTPDKPVNREDLVSAEGACPGTTSAGVPANANALSDGAAAAPSANATVALGHTECDVVRGIAPPTASTSQQCPWRSGGGGQLFRADNAPESIPSRAGRLTSIERGSEPGAEPNTAKPKAKKKPAPT